MRIYKTLKYSTCIVFILIILYSLSLDGYAYNSSPIYIEKQIKSHNEDYIRDKRTKKIVRNQSKLQSELYQYLLIPNHRASIKNKAIKLNNGNARNSCVYFASESLRRIGFKIPLRVSNIGSFNRKHNSSLSLIKELKSMNWQTSTNPSLLLPGDICFTAPNYNGFPTHVYVFMGWVRSGHVDYAYVCDNQSYDYGYTLHIRNIKDYLPGKDAFYKFMYISN